ncbi:unnamed protein product [Clavelina lepadiformis]|uniref:Dual specificity protein phosphatase 22 n=1 Tax=Clavelina lepadiformis TaxID=159417 RepID=A0ABP0FU22_CLALP
MGNGMNKILPGLFVGNFRDAKDEEQLEQNNITHILSIHDNARPLLADKKYLCIYASDTPGQDLMPYFRQCAMFIHEARTGGGSVLVHCLAGVSRSVTVTVAYIMTVTGHTWRDTLNAVRQSRTVANPNYGFQTQLQKYEEEKVVEERKWFSETYGHNTLGDQLSIKELSKQYEENSQQNLVERNSNLEAQPSGSTSASYPLNKPDEMLPSAWDKAKRIGMLVDDYDPSIE